MGVCGCMRVHVGVCGCMRVYVGVCGCMWLYVNCECILGFLVYAGVYGCMWVYVDVCGCMWMYVASCRWLAESAQDAMELLKRGEEARRERHSRRGGLMKRYCIRRRAIMKVIHPHTPAYTRIHPRTLAHTREHLRACLEVFVFFLRPRPSARSVA